MLHIIYMPYLSLSFFFCFFLIGVMLHIIYMPYLSLSKIEGGSHEVQNILVTKLLHVITSIQMSELSAKYQIEPAINAHCILKKRGLNNFKRKRKRKKRRRKKNLQVFNQIL